MVNQGSNDHTITDTNNMKLDNSERFTIKPSSKRHFILLMFSICSMQKSFQWISISAITNKVALYYGVDNIAVNWTSVLFMITFIPLVLPTGWLIERIGLRKAILIGSTGITLGAIVKCFATSEDRFYVLILGQIIVSLSEQFIFCIPARIASVWFPDNQVTLATGFGIFGNQCGIALGFIIPQYLLKGFESRAEIGIGLHRLYLYPAILAVVILIILFISFDEAPKYAPGLARLKKIQEEQEIKGRNLSFTEDMKLFVLGIKDLISNINNLCLVVAYGINVGIGYTIQTLMNQLITTASWPDANEIVGRAGMVVILSGMIGAIFWGHVCDATHKYILITKSLYFGAMVSILAFGITLSLFSELALYVAAAAMGFVLIGYTVAGLDTIVELTYPTPELISTSLIVLAPQISSIGLIFVGSSIVDNYGCDTAIGFLLGCLVVGFVITLMIREHLNRQLAAEEVDRNLHLKATQDIPLS